MSTKDRLKEFLSSQKVGRNKFEEQIGVSIGYLSTKSVTITSDVIEKTVMTYPNLSLDWLITGKGSMLKMEETGASFEGESVPNYDIKELETEIITLKAENKVLRELAGLGERKDSKNKSA